MIRLLAPLLALALAAPALAHPPEAERRIGDALLSEGDAYRAITAYKRYLVLAPDAADQDLVRYRIALAYLVGEQDDAAWRAAARIGGRPEVDLAARLLVGRALYGLERYDLALDVLGPLDAPYAHYVVGWTHLRRFELRPAADAFAAMGTDEGRVLAAALRRPDALPYRSPVLAGLLSLVPGLGHAYLGLWGVAASSLTWNGAFLWGMYETGRSGQWGLFALLSVLESLWYFGGIYGAVIGAERFNRDARLDYLDAVAARHPPPGLPPQPDLAEAPPLGLTLGVPIP